MSNGPSKLRTAFAIAAAVAIDGVGLLAAIGGTTAGPLGLAAGLTTAWTAGGLARKAYYGIKNG